MADAASNNEDSLPERALAAVESNDLPALKNMLAQRLAEDPLAFPLGGLGDALNRALELARYNLADELFKRGMQWNYGTIADVLEGAREDNEWNIKAIDLALAHGWDINEHYEHVGSALVYTVSCADSGLEDPHGDTACLKMAAYLLSKGADVNEGSQTCSNPLELACSNVDKEMVALLLAHGASMEKAPKALLHAAEEGSIEIMQMLLDHGADVNAHPYGRYTTLPCHQNSESWGSTLHCAVQGGHAESVTFLLDNGADKNYKNKVGVTALELAKKLGHDEIVQLIE